MYAAWTVVYSLVCITKLSSRSINTVYNTEEENNWGEKKPTDNTKAFSFMIKMRRYLRTSSCHQRKTARKRKGTKSDFGQYNLKRL